MPTMVKPSKIANHGEHNISVRCADIFANHSDRAHGYASSDITDNAHISVTMVGLIVGLAMEWVIHVG